MRLLRARCRFAPLQALVLSLVLGAVGEGRPARAQQSDPWRAAPDSVPRHAIQVWAGYSPSSVRVLGRVAGARFGEAGVRYRRLLAYDEDGSRALDYVASVLPVVAMTYTPVRGAPPAAQQRGEHTLYGFGLTPAGLRVRGIGAGSRWQPYLEGGIGFVYFQEPLPDQRGERFNFTIRVGTGVRLQAAPGATFTLGYRFHHLSNGFRGQINPGFDSNVFHLGVTLTQF